MQPLVLAIEPDLRQAAIVKRIVREKVLADVTVVDSRDAALEAMRTTVPDVLLLSALLSPRDEDELFAHLRTLEHAEHLQTHTIPQLASANGHDGEKPSKGLLAAFRRRKGTGSAPAGCDPEIFADEVRTYLQRASEKKREVRDAAVTPVISPAARTKSAEAPAPQTSETASPPVASSWESPFEWRPTRETKAAVTPAAEPAAPEAVAGPRPGAFAVPLPEPVVVPPYESVVAPEPEPVAVEPEPVAVARPEPVVVASPEPVVVASSKPIVAAEPVVFEPEPVVVARAEPIVIASSEPAPVPRPQPVVVTAPAPAAVRSKLPLVKRHAREWWFEEQDAPAPRGDTDSELRDVLAMLSVPLHVAAFAYPEGCRIRRVRLNAD